MVSSALLLLACTTSSSLDALWKEHLGVDIPINKPDSRWLELWQEIAFQNIKSLNKKEPHLQSQISPYSQDVQKQLENLKIDTDG